MTPLLASAAARFHDALLSGRYTYGNQWVVRSVAVSRREGSIHAGPVGGDDCRETAWHLAARGDDVEQQERMTVAMDLHLGLWTLL